MLRSAPPEDRESGLLIPLATCLCAFLVIRGVFAQPDIHPMIFMMVGMVIALAARAKAITKVLCPSANRGRADAGEHSHDALIVHAQVVKALGKSKDAVEVFAFDPVLVLARRVALIGSGLE